MKTQSIIICHCLTCGRIDYIRPDGTHPVCCGKPMVDAAFANPPAQGGLPEKGQDEPSTGAASPAAVVPKPR